MVTLPGQLWSGALGLRLAPVDGRDAKACCALWLEAPCWPYVVALRGHGVTKGLKRRKASPLHVMAYGVHVFTAIGAALGFLALEAVIRGDLVLAFVWLGIALFVDAVDGPMARRLNVRETASRYDGALLDLVVDFITYVFVPAAMLLRSDVMGAPWGLSAGMIITIGSALYFADTHMKTEDLWFRGFPAVWNVVVFYIVVFAPPTFVSFGIVLLATILMFVPVIFVHPFRVRRWRALTIIMLIIWSLAAVLALVQGLAPHMAVKAGLFAGAAYFILLGAMRAKRPKAAAPLP